MEFYLVPPTKKFLVGEFIICVRPILHLMASGAQQSLLEAVWPLCAQDYSA